MRAKFFLMAFSLLMGAPAWAIEPPPQSRVDQYIQLALKAKDADLNGSGRYTCEDGINGQHAAKDNNRDRAHLKYVLKCIRAQCASFGNTMAGGIADVLGMSRGELYELLVSTGMSPQEIQKIMATRDSWSASSVPTATCENATAMGRTFVVDSCLTRPVACY